MEVYGILAIATFSVIIVGTAGVILHDEVERRKALADEPIVPLSHRQLDALVESAAEREQRTLDNLAEWGERSDWANGVSIAKTRAYLPTDSGRRRG